MRVLIAVVVVVVMGAAVIGIGQGTSPLRAHPARFASLSAAKVVASKRRIERGGAAVKRGEAVFDEQGCGDCHSLAAVGATGELGPRMDRQRDPLPVIIGNITQPRGEVPPGYDGKLMPTDFSQRMTPRELRDVARFIKAASG